MTDEELKNFKDKLLKHAEMCVRKQSLCQTEEACKQGLILPFISLLGYDVFDINEVTPEHSADFSDKYKNRVDYAILQEGEAVIAIECKLKIEKADRGQLKSYFNACKSVKLGVLTDGINYEFFADCDSPNMMDDEPFIRFSFNDFNQGKIDEEQIKAIASFKKTEFDPDNVGAEAKKKVIFSSIINFLENNLESPSKEFIAYLLRNIEGFNQKITQRVIEENIEIVKSAFQGFVDKRILDRVGLADKRLVKLEDKKDETVADNAQVTVSDVVTTADELAVYAYIKQRLAFLVNSDELYQGINQIVWRDYKTKFVVFYKKERCGRLFTFIENSDGTVSFYFAGTEKEVKCSKNKYQEIDDLFLNAYLKAFNEVK